MWTSIITMVNIEAQKVEEDIAMSMIVTILPSLRAYVNPDGQIWITNKFLEGVQAYLEHCDVKVLIRKTSHITDNLDNVQVDPTNINVPLTLVDNYEEHTIKDFIRESTIVMASADDLGQKSIGEICSKLGIPCVYVSEYTFKTRVQQMRASVQNPLRQLWKYFRLYHQELQIRQALNWADGLQCNGTPTLKDYGTITRSPHLYFDNRVRSSMLISQESLEIRIATLRLGNPLRLFFSGRLARIKGVDHLIDVAIRLRALGTPFTMAICGAGERENALKERIEREKLSGQVELLGVLEFSSELVPYVKANVDLFVCCHPQGDPSCTYLETMACGVPIIGYDNEAMAGIVEQGVGWCTPLNAPNILADAIAKLNQDREQIEVMSRKSRNFAELHTFENVFYNRIEHLRTVVKTSHKFALAGKSA